MTSERYHEEETRNRKTASPEEETERSRSSQEIPVRKAEQGKVVEPSESTQKAPEEERQLSEDALKVLTIIDSIYRNKGSMQISIFEVKDFLENLCKDLDVDSIYSELRQRDYVPKTKDSEQFYMNYQGQEEARKHQDLLLPELERIFEYAQQFLLKDESLRRLLLLVYLNEYKARKFLNRMAQELEPTKRILSTLFLDKDFSQLPPVAKIARNLRKEYPVSLFETMQSYCDDPAFLIGLVSQRL